MIKYPILKKFILRMESKDKWQIYITLNRKKKFINIVILFI